METCDVCKIEFPSSNPNSAVVDAKIQGLGLWGFLCEAHKGLAVKGFCTPLPVAEEVEVEV